MLSEWRALEVSFEALPERLFWFAADVRDQISKFVGLVAELRGVQHFRVQKPEVVVDLNQLAHTHMRLTVSIHSQ